MFSGYAPKPIGLRMTLAPADTADNSDRVLVRLENVSKTFQMGEMAVEALRGVSLEIYAGEFLVMVGPSGSGKTTILNLVGGLDSVTDGRVWFAEREITRFSPGELTRYRRDTVGFVFQSDQHIPPRNVFDAQLTKGQESLQSWYA